MKHRKIHGFDVMKELIEKKVLAKNWTFNEISNLSETINLISNDIYSEMTLIERFKMIEDLRIKESYVGQLYTDVLREMVRISLKAEVAGTIKVLLNTATVNFGGNKNEISERSMGGKPHKERTTDEKKNSKNKK
tara:strand:+ start:424 stop:828 length:405 start_codon:yes stop_codon:yes gene_type:complete